MYYSFFLMILSYNSLFGMLKEKQKQFPVQEAPSGVLEMIKGYLLKDKDISHWLKTHLPPQRYPIEGHAGMVTSVHVAPNRTAFAVGNGFLHVTTFRDPKAITSQCYEGHGDSMIHTMTDRGVGVKRDCVMNASSDGRWVFSGGNDGRVILWDCREEETVTKYSFKDHTDPVTSIAMTPDARFGISGGDAGSVRFWDLRGDPSKIHSQLLSGHTTQVASVAIAENGMFALSGSSGRDSKLMLWDLRNPHKIQGYELNGHTKEDYNMINSVALSADGTKAITGSSGAMMISGSSGECIVWDLQDIDHVQWYFLEHSPYSVREVHISSDGIRALTVGPAGARIWDLHDLNTPRSHVPWNIGSASVILTPDGRWAAMSRWDEKLRKAIFELWNVNDLDHPVVYPLSENDVAGFSCLSISPDCRWLLWGGGWPDADYGPFIEKSTGFSDLYDLSPSDDLSLFDLISIILLRKEKLINELDQARHP